MSGTMDRDRMIDQIFETVRNADEETLEQFYWFLMMEMES